MQTRSQKVAVVTGAGRAIALVLGGIGATVYVTGRSSRGDSTTENVQTHRNLSHYIAM